MDLAVIDYELPRGWTGMNEASVFGGVIIADLAVYELKTFMRIVSDRTAEGGSVVHIAAEQAIREHGHTLSASREKHRRIGRTAIGDNQIFENVSSPINVKRTRIFM